MIRVEDDVKSLHREVSDVRVAVASLTAEVAAHDKRDTDRHDDLKAEFTLLKSDMSDFRGELASVRTDLHRTVDSAVDRVAAQTRDVIAASRAEEQATTRQRIEMTGKVALAVVGLAGTIAGLVYGFGPVAEAPTKPAAPVTAPAAAPTPAAPAPTP
jgi:hypothetical protein